MRRRFPLLLKKRGRRRTGSPLWARVGEVLYHVMFVAMGVIGLWWSLSDVLLPEWRLAKEAEGFTRSDCTVVGERVTERPGLAEPEYCAELEVVFADDAGEERRVWTRHGVGRDTPSQAEAAAALERYRLGDELPCWFDATNPDRVLLSVKQRWWPWLVLSIPVSLVVIGAFGLTRAFVSTQSSPERRSSLMAGGLDLSRLESTGLRPTVASGLPTLEQPGENAGVERQYRLPADGAEGWRVASMATLCAVWNVLVALFAYQIGVGYLSPAVRFGVAALVATPLAVIGWRMTRSTWRDARGVGGGGVTRVEIDRHPLRVGEVSTATLLQSGQMRIRSLVVCLVCDEIATYRQGTDTRTATAEVSRRPLLTHRRLVIDTDEPLTLDFELSLPADAPHSFVSPNNEVRWSIEALIEPMGRPEMKRRFPLCVFPRDVPGRSGAPSTPAPTSAEAVL
ncbi:hypothetical protein MalM25_20890 [Planctomycetes bacterium MalM25]|nr:hypothetical protein MalM25_20890 [Planctomycetes bacterium MalM25]